MEKFSENFCGISCRFSEKQPPPSPPNGCPERFLKKKTVEEMSIRISEVIPEQIAERVPGRITKEFDGVISEAIHVRFSN